MFRQVFWVEVDFIAGDPVRLPRGTEQHVMVNPPPNILKVLSKVNYVG